MLQNFIPDVDWKEEGMICNEKKENVKKEEEEEGMSYVRNKRFERHLFRITVCAV